MSSSLQVKVTSRTREGSEEWQGTVTIPGLRPTKLVRKSDGSLVFASRSSVLTSARSLAKKFGFDGLEVVENARSRGGSRAVETSSST